MVVWAGGPVDASSVSWWVCVGVGGGGIWEVTGTLAEGAAEGDGAGAEEGAVEEDGAGAEEGAAEGAVEGVIAGFCCPIADVGLTDVTVEGLAWSAVLLGSSEKETEEEKHEEHHHQWCFWLI